jgi:lipoate-protein ligase A
VLSLEARPELHDVALSYELILGRVAGALGVQRRGLSDLALGDRKISGNSQRRGRRALLHHGTILYNFDIDCIGRFLKEPDRQPSYRSGRRHSDFMANLSMPVERITERIAEAVCSFAPRLALLYAR